MLRFIVIADSHIRHPDEEVDAYPSNAWLVGRNEFVVDLCNRVDASFVVHLGDIVHPLPVEETHSDAIALARGVYERLTHPIHFVAGNHDVGDKPNAHVAVPAVAEENYPVFESAWGKAHRSFDEGDCHFVIIDTQVMNSGLDREDRQRHWLEADIEAARSRGMRIFVFSHYPPFVRDRHENEHYDNLGEPARSWLLDLFVRNGVEALFSGHVHNFLYNRHEETDMYVAPSTGFVRPDYAELASVSPSFENGRDDPPKLGMFVVDVTRTGHRVQPIRTYGLVDRPEALPMALETALQPDWESPVGVTIRHGWMSVVDFPTSGLDEFSRKSIRNDGPLLALWEARIRDLRIPASDLLAPGGSLRVADLAGMGMRFTVYSPGVPDEQTITAIRRSALHLHRWEIIVSPRNMGETIAALARVRIDGLRTAIAPIVPIGEPSTGVNHFVASGFSADTDEGIESLVGMDADGLLADLVFRIDARSNIVAGLTRAAGIANRVGRSAVVIVELPRASESVAFTDDDAVGACVARTAEAALDHREVSLFLDAFIDHDRGYYPRHGLIDRAYNPRAALYRLIELAASAQTTDRRS